MKQNSTPSPAQLPDPGSVPFPIKSKSQHNDAPTPALPPVMESVRSHTADDMVRMLNRTPLFMTSLEDAENGDDGENLELEAIRALQYEGPRSEVALGFKENGNEMVKAKRWKDGKEFYTQALGVLHKESNQDSTSGLDQVAEIQKQKKIEEACYVNRALCNLELQNYRSTTLDCASTLRLNPSNSKAYYRSALALLALSKLPEALDACNIGLSLTPNSPPFSALLSRINTQSAALAAREQERAQTKARALREKQTLHAALLSRGITIRASASPPSLEDAVIHLSPDALSPASTLVFPLLLLYPLHAQSDFIKAVPETDALVQHLEYIFPLPWDAAREYSADTVELYAETGKAGGGLIKVGRKVPLLAWLGDGKVVVMDGVVKVNVLVKGRAGGWIEEVKARRGK
ncbi:hypothetical protein MMC07_001653 [Pseudocyphellaria aurata]|nr:hypothetical protein [Pseudocyphellaria aurata]